MKYKIVVDSSCDLKNDYIKDEDVGFEVVPLTITVDGKEYIDNDDIDVDDLLYKMSESKEKGMSACPSSGYYAKSYEGAEHVIVITISSKLSGSYNSAYLGSTYIDNKVHVVDSKLASGGLTLLVDKAYELIKSGKDFLQICKCLDDYRDSLNLFFVLDKFDNLVKNGRMSKITAFVANALYIKPLCVANDGVIDIYEKPRTMKGALNRLVESIGKKISKTSDRRCVISHCNNKEDALMLKKAIEEKYNFKEVKISKMRGLCSFYALSKGLIVSF